MKQIKLLLPLLFVVIMLASCGSTQTAAYQKSQSSFIQFTGTKYSKVTVMLDDETQFEANVNPASTNQTKREYTYQISTGAHTVSVLYDGQEILSKKIFVSQQNVAVVELP